VLPGCCTKQRKVCLKKKTREGALVGTTPGDAAPSPEEAAAAAASQ
jgi:hypothetical protein